MNIISNINNLKKQKNAVILAHFYQISEIQEIADYIGDSLGLAQNALKTNADIIVFAGVHFMAETAKILNPLKKVIVPDINAGCSLADSCPPAKFSEFINKHKDHIVISYINCSAEVKALSDIICTSSNAVKIVNSLPKEQKIIFAPDKNLGAYINSITGRKMLLWDGTCEVHNILSIEKVLKLKQQYPDAKIIAHPECKDVILKIADFIGSTTQLLDFTKKDNADKFIIATETGILYKMRQQSPEKEFFIVPADDNCACNDCPYMKLNTLDKLYKCLFDEKPEIILSQQLIEKAKKPILRMLNIS
ncbi:MAG: quinolinate synthase NadA [Bacteroidales bacterium]|nr:quinolinate synthase NadA [Bacteroidales bacterium]